MLHHKLVCLVWGLQRKQRKSCAQRELVRKKLNGRRHRSIPEERRLCHSLCPGHVTTCQQNAKATSSQNSEEFCRWKPTMSPCKRMSQGAKRSPSFQRCLAKSCETQLVGFEASLSFAVLRERILSCHMPICRCHDGCLRVRPL